MCLHTAPGILPCVCEMIFRQIDQGKESIWSRGCWKMRISSAGDYKKWEMNCEEGIDLRLADSGDQVKAA